MVKKEDIKQALKEWFERQDKWKTKKELAKELGIPYSTVKKYFSEGRVPKTPGTRMKLYQLTKLRYFEPDVTKAPGVEPVSIEIEVEPTGTMMQTIMPALNTLSKRITKDVSQRNKIKSSVRRISQAWAKEDFNAVNRIVYSNTVATLLRYYPEAEITVEKIKMLLEQKADFEIDELELKLKNYCDDNEIKLNGRSPRFIIDHLINVEFNRKRKSAKVGNLHLQIPEWIKIEQSIEEERKRVWGRDFSFLGFYNDLFLSYESIIKHQHNPTGWVRLADVYQILRKEIEKRNPDWKSRKRLVAYYKDEFSADLSKLWRTQSSGDKVDKQIEFNSIRDPRLSFKVILPDGTTASYGFVRPKR